MNDLCQYSRGCEDVAKFCCMTEYMTLQNRENIGINQNTPAGEDVISVAKKNLNST